MYASSSSRKWIDFIRSVASERRASSSSTDRMPMTVPDDGGGGDDDAMRAAAASRASSSTREAYVREDVACGSAECSTHARANARAGCADVLASVADGARWYVVFDADAVVRYAEAIERGCVENVIVARSTLRRLEPSGPATLRGRAMRAIRRAGADKRLRVHVFDDEHCAGTSRVGKRLVGLARASRECATAAYYAEKVRGKFPVVVVVADALASAFAEEENDGGSKLPDGVIVTTGRGFAEKFLTTDADAGARAAFDAAHVASARRETTEDAENVGTSYEAHWSEKDIEEGLESGNLITGALEVKTLGVVCEGYVDGVFIPSKRAMNRAFHGDDVVVALEPKERWASSRVNTVMEEDETAAAANALPSDEKEDDAAETCASGARRVRTGRIVGVARRRVVDVVACLDSVDEEDIVRNPHAKRNGALCVPMDGKIVKIKLLTRRASDLVGMRFVVRVDEWRTNQRYPNGHLIKILGAVGDVDGEMAALLARYDVPTDPFGAQALAELPRDGASWTVPECEYATRRDLRHHRACSIDPPGCTDVDDALSVHFLPEVNPQNGGSIEIGVHIADVSHFVRPGTLLDYEARLRGTTVYLVDRRLDMLPSLLSENLASLLEKRDRLALSCVWTLNDRLDVVDVWFGKSVIHSRHQMTYHQAQAIYDGVSTTTEDAVAFGVEETGVVRRDLKMLVDFASKVNAVRASHGAVELESAELRFETDAQTKSPTEVIQKREVPMMRVVAELMILANSAAAKTIHAAFPTSAFLRRHAPPREDGFAELKRLAAARDVELDCSSGEALNASLARISTTFADSEIATLFKGLATRAMSEAQYVSSGSIPAEDSGFGHYGLALTHYTHFTSPIRRYADIIVHRQIVAALDQARGGSDAQAVKKFESDRSLAHGALEPIATHLNERNRASKRAQSRCGEIYLLWLLREKPLVEPAVIHEIRDDGFLVFLPSFHIKASVRLRDQDGRAIAELASDDDLERFVVSVTGAPSHSHVRATPQTGVVDETTETSDASIRVVKSTDRSLVRSYELLQKVWVRLSCRDSRAQGPKLDLRLLDAEKHPGVAEAKISRSSSERQLVDSAPSSLSSVMRRVIEETTPTPTQSGDKIKRKISVDKDDADSSSYDDDGDDDDDAVATKLNVSAKSSKRRVNSSSFSKLHIHDTTTTAVVITDDGPDANLRVHRNQRQSASTPPSALIHRQRAARAWARLASTRFFGARGRARYERRRQRVEERYAALR